MVYFMGDNIGYRLLFRWVLFLHRQYYRKIEIEGIEHIPDGRVIFSPNHQNAIMDALAVLCTVKKPIFFVARGDFFKNKVFAAILRFLKIYPAYRRIEGFQHLTNNYATLAMAKRWLLAGKPVCIFPEGGHEGSWQLRPLSKGLFRLALDTQSAVPREPVYIVPVSIYYSSYTKWGSYLHVKFGKPINTLEVYKTWKMNKALGIKQLKDKVQHSMQQIVLQADEKFYSFIVKLAPYVLASYGRSDAFDLLQKFVNQCNKLSQQLPSLMEQVSIKFDTCYQQITALRICPSCVGTEISLMRIACTSLIRLLLSPFALLLLLYFFPFLLFANIFNRFITDRQFHSSVRFVILALLPIWHGIAVLLIWKFTQNILLVGIFAIVFILLSGKGYLAIDFFSQWKCEWICYRRRAQLKLLRQEIKEILGQLNFINPYVAENKARKNTVSRY